MTVFLYHLRTMKQKLWITLITYIAYCIDKELYKAIDYLKTQAEVLIEHQEKQNKRILLTNVQRMRIAAKAKRLSRKMLEDCTVLFTGDTVIGWYNKLIAKKYDGSCKAKNDYVGFPWTSIFNCIRDITFSLTHRIFALS